MSLIKKIAFAVIAVVVVLVAFAYVTAARIYTPTTGAPIGRYANPSKALLVIDVQEDYTGVNGGKAPLLKNADGPIKTINKLIDAAGKSGMQVVYVRQLFENNWIMRTFVNRTIEGLPGTELDSRIKKVNENDFTKKISDAFSNPKLTDFLVNHQVTELYLTGLDAAYCVHKTALGGLNRGYKVTVITDAVMTQKNMNDILKQYDRDGIRQITSDEVIARMTRATKNPRAEGYRILPED